MNIRRVGFARVLEYNQKSIHSYTSVKSEYKHAYTGKYFCIYTDVHINIETHLDIFLCITGTNLNEHGRIKSKFEFGGGI